MDAHTQKQDEELEVEAATLVVTWTDCGDADTHTKLTDLQPTEIITGQTTTLVDPGALDEDIAGAAGAMTLKAAGVKIASCSGDPSKDVVCKLPLGVGSVTMKTLTFPIKEVNVGRCFVMINIVAAERRGPNRYAQEPCLERAGPTRNIGTR